MLTLKDTKYQGTSSTIMCTLVCKKISRCNKRSTWLNEELLSSKPKRTCIEGRSRAELPRRGIEISAVLISWCEIRKARAQLDLQVMRGLSRASCFSRTCSEGQEAVFSGHKATVLHSGGG